MTDPELRSYVEACCRHRLDARSVFDFAVPDDLEEEEYDDPEERSDDLAFLQRLRTAIELDQLDQLDADDRADFAEMEQDVAELVSDVAVKIAYQWAAHLNDLARGLAPRLTATLHAMTEDQCHRFVARWAVDVACAELVHVNEPDPPRPAHWGDDVVVTVPDAENLTPEDREFVEIRAHWCVWLYWRTSRVMAESELAGGSAEAHQLLPA